jgi:flagellar FliJ protein
LKSFSFDLEKYLELRKYREQETEIELARTIAVLNELEQELKTVTEERVQASAEEFAPGNSIRDIQNYELYILRLDIKREQLFEALTQAELEVEKARAVYVEAARDRKVVDKLKEKKLIEYKKS